MIAALKAEEALGLDQSTGELADERAEALARYRGAPFGNEVDGRSQIVDRSIMDTIEWIMPSLIRIYLGGDEIGKFDPRGPEDEEPAKIETDVCNWYLEAKNDLFSQVSATLRDALLLKNGYMVGLWQCKRDTMAETYVGKTEDEVALLMQDPEITVLEQTPRQDPIYGTVYDLKVEMKKADEFVQAESLPPDELIVSRRHRWTSLLDCDFVEWVRRNVTIGQLRAEGFEVEDGEGTFAENTIEWVNRDRFQATTNPAEAQDETQDPTRRVVTLRDAYIRMDLNGTGTQQLWRLVRIEGSTRLLLKEEANIIPFAAFSPIVYPHSHIGTSVYDLLADLAIIKTTLERQALDGIYLQNSGRLGIDVDKMANVDDLLISRPGQHIRFNGPPGDAMVPIPVTDASPAILGMLEFIESQKEARSGVTRYSAGLDANTLNKTATGVQSIQAAANQRIELIARTLAGGFKDLFLIVHALASKYCTKELQIKLNGEWKVVDPREWKKRTGFSISVGLGTGTPEQQLQKLMSLSPLMQQEMGLGLAGPTEAYNFAVEVWKSAGYKNSDKFIKPPQKVPQTNPQTGQPVMGPDGQPVMVDAPPPQQENPVVSAEKIKGQTQIQMAQMKAQSDGQIAQAKAQADSQVQAARAQADMAIQQHKIATDAQLEIEKTKLQLQLDDIRHSREQATAIEIARINAEAKVAAANITATKQADAMAQQALDRDVGG